MLQQGQEHNFFYTGEERVRKRNKKEEREEKLTETPQAPYYRLTASQLPINPTSRDGASSTAESTTFSPTTSFGPNLLMVCTTS